MMTAIAITSAGSLGDGVHAALRVSGVASGGILFSAYPAPEVEQAIQVSAFQPDPFLEPELWHVRLPSANLWYLWATDDSGATDPFPVWVDIQEVGYNPGPDIAQAAEKLQEILLSHVPGINAAIQRVFHVDAGLKIVHYGSASALREFPSILIHQPTVRVEWVAFPMVREYLYSFQIVAMIIHQDRASLMPIANHMCGVIMEILNNPIYDRISLANGTELTFCLAETGDATEGQIDEALWSAMASINWSGRTLTTGTLVPPQS